MSASAADIAQLRRMTAEPTTTTYSDAVLTTVIEKFPIPDSLHFMPEEEDDWTPTYDLNAAAAEVWSEKLAALQGNTDFSADGGNYSDSQKFDQADRMVRFYLSRRSSHTIHLKKWPPERKTP